MCLAVPAKITKIEGNVAEADMAGTLVRASLTLTPEAKVGDYVLLHTGYAISVVDEEEAKETLKIFQQLEMIEDVDETG